MLPTILFYDGSEKLPLKWNEWLEAKGYDTNQIQGPQTSFWSEIAREHAFYLGLMGRGYIPGNLMDYAPLEVHPYGIDTSGEVILMTGFGTSANPVLRISDLPPRAVFTGKGFWKWFFHPSS